jgi:hypothetical protein
MLGGAVVASTHVLQRKVDTIAYGLAYVVIGAGFGFGTAAASPLLPHVTIASFQDALVVGFFGGAIGTALVATGNFSLAFIFKRLGVEVDVKVTQNNKECWNGNRKSDEDREGKK